jgi:hypothetical protein
MNRVLLYYYKVAAVTLLYCIVAVAVAVAVAVEIAGLSGCALKHTCQSIICLVYD